MNFVRERLGKWIEAAIILVVGILCIVAGAAMGNNDPEAASNALKGISTTLGIVLVVVGSLSIALAIVVVCLAKKGFLPVALPGGILLAFGISLLVTPYAADFIFLFLYVLPFLLICVGGVILCEAIFDLVFGIIGKKVKQVLVLVIVLAIVATVAIVLGALCIGKDPVIKTNVQLIVFGIVCILMACLQVLSTFIKVPTLVVVTKEEVKE